MNTTSNLHLKKPSGTDPIDISVLNENADTLDAFAGETNTALAGKQDTLAFDDVPTEDSQNILTSGTLYTQFGRHVIYGSGMQIEQNADLDALTTRGTYYCNSAEVASVANTPTGLTNAFRIDVWVLPASRRQQRLYPVGSVPMIYIRNSTASGWGAWHVFEGTAVT